MSTLDDLLPIRRMLDAAGNVLAFARDLAIDSSLALSNNTTTRVATLSLSGKSTQRAVSGLTYVVDSIATDFLLDVDTSVASAAKLPVPTAGRVLWFLDKTGTAAANPFTIKRNAAELINGAAADFVVSSNRAMVRVECDGTNWFVATFSPTPGLTLAGTTTLEANGAKGDGVASDSTAYTAALATTKTILLGAANYLTTAAYTGSLAAKQSLRGVGGQSIITDLGNQPIVAVGGDGCMVSDLRLVGTFGAGAANIGINGGTFSSTIVDNVFIDTVGRDGVYFGTPQSQANYGPTISNVRVFAPVNGAGIRLDGMQYASVVNCKGYGGTYGVYIDAGNAVVSTCNFDNNTYGAYINSVNGNDGHGVLLGCTLNHNTIEAFHCEKLLNGFDVRDSELYYGDIRVIGGIGAGYPTLVRFKDCDIDVANWQLDGALVEVDGCKVATANANTVNLNVNAHASTLIVRPNILKIDGTPFDFTVNTRWDTPSNRSHEHRFGGVVKHLIEGAHGVVTAGNGGTDAAAHMGPLTSFEASYSALWLLLNGVARTGTNCVLDSNGSDLFISSPHSLGFGKIFEYALNSVLLATKDPVALKYTIPLQIVSTRFTSTTPQAITLATGANANVAATSSKLRVTGPAGAFSISGFAQPVDGSAVVLDGAELTVFNMTAQALTLTNLATSAANNQIDTLTGADVVLPTRKSFARFSYDATSAKWLLTDHS